MHFRLPFTVKDISLFLNRAMYFKKYRSKMGYICQWKIIPGRQMTAQLISRGTYSAPLQWRQWRLKSPEPQLFAQLFVGADQRKHQSSASLAFMSGSHRSPLDFPSQRVSIAENVSIWWGHHVTVESEFAMIPACKCRHLPLSEELSDPRLTPPWQQLSRGFWTTQHSIKRNMRQYFAWTRDKK